MSASMLVALLAAAAFPAYASASPTGGYGNDYQHSSKGVCTDYTIKQTVTSANFGWALPEFSDNLDVVSFLTNIVRRDAATLPSPLSPPKNVTKDFEIFASFCSPKTKKEGKEKTVLVATHGLGYDGRYWASSYRPDQYSFVDHALDSGYSVFWYDRLGTGKSQKVSGYEAQASSEAEILKGLVHLVRNGKYTADVRASKVVLVGHSFGSATSNLVLTETPDLVDGAVLTGYAFPNSTADLSRQAWVPTAITSRIARTISPKYHSLSTGYLGFGDIYGHVEGFFHAPFDAATIAYAQSISQPYAITELLSLGTLNPAAPGFKGKVLVTTGEFDFIYCAGLCAPTYAATPVKSVFPKAAAAETYLHPGAGHGVNFAQNATVFYSHITSFLDKNF